MNCSVDGEAYNSRWGVLLLRLIKLNPMKPIPPERREAILARLSGMDSRRQRKRDQANRAERNRQPPGCPKGEPAVRRRVRQRGGLKRLGLSAARRLLISTPDAAPIPDLLSSATRGRGASRYESGVGDTLVTRPSRLNQGDRPLSTLS